MKSTLLLVRNNSQLFSIIHDEISSKTQGFVQGSIVPIGDPSFHIRGSIIQIMIGEILGEFPGLFNPFISPS